MSLLEALLCALAPLLGAVLVKRLKTRLRCDLRVVVAVKVNRSSESVIVSEIERANIGAK